MLLSHLRSWLLELIGVAISSFTYFKNPFGVEDTLLIHPSLPLLSLRSGQWRYQNTDDSIGDCSSKLMAAYHDYPLDKESRDKAIGSGWNKHVYQVEQGIVIKKLNGKGVSLVGCHQDSKCIENFAKGFIKEIGFIMKLQGNPSVPQIFAYCIPHDFSYNFHQLSIVVSAGFTPLDVIFLLQSDWTRRLQISSQILDFVSRIWPVQLHDFRRQQFVLSSQKIPVYVDFDDASEAQKHVFAGDENFYDSVNQDIEYSRKIASRTYEDFSKDFFWIGAPKEASKCLAELKHFYTNGTLDVPKFQKIVKKLLEL